MSSQVDYKEMAAFFNGQLNTYDYRAKESHHSLQKIPKFSMTYKSANIFQNKQMTRH